MTWMSRALCRTRPADWWDLGDPGNRLALALCSVCPERPLCADGDPEPHAVIRGGVAYGVDGQALPLCACGRPVPYVPRAECYTCWPSNRTVIPVAKRRGRPRLLDTHLAAVVDMLSQGIAPTRIGKLIGVPPSTVRYWVQHYQLRPARPPGCRRGHPWDEDTPRDRNGWRMCRTCRQVRESCPQAVSTVVDGSAG